MTPILMPVNFIIHYNLTRRVLYAVKMENEKFCSHISFSFCKAQHNDDNDENDKEYDVTLCRGNCVLHWH